VSSNNKKIKIAICGLGTFAKKRLLPALQKVKSMELVAVVSNNTEGLKDYSNIEKFKSLEDMLKIKDLDVVHISTPNALHYSQTIQCLESSMDVICEKPLATTMKHAKEMLSIAQAENRHLLVAHMLRVSPAILRVKKIIDSGYIGSLLLIKIELNYSVDPTIRKWLLNSEISGGGCVLDSGIHCIDIAQFLTGKDWDLSSSVLKKNEFGIETKARIILVSEQVKCKININSNESYSSSLKVVGTEFTILVNNFSASWNSSKFQIYDNNKQVIVDVFDVDVSSVYQNQYDQFSCVLSKRDLNYSIVNDAIKSLKLVEQIYQI